jgi:hypothetical protein
VSSDLLTAIMMMGAWCLSAINVWALIKDGDAKGVRPYASLYFAVSNTMLAMSLWHLDQTMSATATGMIAVLNLTNAALIIRYQWLPKRAKI